MTTFMAKSGQVQRKWYVLDAAGKTLGALAAEAAVLLRGKHKPVFTPHVDTGDFVIVINAEKVELTGKKLPQKEMITPFPLSRWFEADQLRYPLVRPSRRKRWKRRSEACCRKTNWAIRCIGS